MSKDNEWTPEEIIAEIHRCKASPYYFMTKYWMVGGKPFDPKMSEKDFNELFFNLIYQNTPQKIKESHDFWIKNKIYDEHQRR
jgi:hypothetical protein